MAGRLVRDFPHHPKCRSCGGKGCSQCNFDGLDWSVPHPLDGGHECNGLRCALAERGKK